MILEVYPSGPALTNCILLACSQTLKGVIIDAPLDITHDLLIRIDELGLTIEKLLITHSHWDHIVDAAILKKKLEIPVYIHEADAPNLKNPGIDKLPLFVEVLPVEPDHYLQDKERLMVGELELEVIHTPGHSPGSVCFYIKKEKVLISGDTLFKGTIGNLSFPTSNPDKMWSSLERLSQLPKDTRVFPGHGKDTTIGAEEWLSHAKEYFGG